MRCEESDGRVRDTEGKRMIEWEGERARQRRGESWREILIEVSGW